ncbi:MAG: hypothetical protein FJW95_07930 [Actinobacteria bacterium]|nr:hypothetical protein [Actinomycetota bacterium]
MRNRARGRRAIRTAGSFTLALVAGVALLGACTPEPPPGDDPVPPPTAAPPPSVYDAACAGSLTASTPGTITDGAVVELSGIVASRANAGVWWVHNDSATGLVRNVLYALADDGASRGAFTVTNATNVDWEDIAVGPGPTPGVHHLYVADIGDNSAQRANVVVYRLPEPTVTGSSASVTADTLTFTYPSGARYDAESLMVDPLSGKLYIVTKGLGSSLVFEAPAGLADASSTPLSLVATVPVPGVFEAFTAADVTADGAFVALRTDALSGNGSVVIYPRPAGQPLGAAFSQTPCAGAAGAEVQGEAIGFTPDGRGYVTASEGASPALHRFDAP